MIWQTRVAYAPDNGRAPDVTVAYAPDNHPGPDEPAKAVQARETCSRGDEYLYRHVRRVAGAFMLFLVLLKA